MSDEAPRYDQPTGWRQAAPGWVPLFQLVFSFIVGFSLAVLVNLVLGALSLTGLDIDVPVAAELLTTSRSFRSRIA